MKKAYETPMISTLGRVEDVTQSRSFFRVFDNRGLFGQSTPPPGLS